MTSTPWEVSSWSMWLFGVFLMLGCGGQRLQLAAPEEPGDCQWEAVPRLQEAPFTEVRFSTPRKGFGISEDCVWSSVDGGWQWQRIHCHAPLQERPEPLHHLRVARPGEVWVLAGERLLLSHDEGRTWQAQEFRGVTLRDVALSEGGTGWLAGDRRLEDPEGLWGTLYQSTDGGRTWRERPLGVSPEEPWHLGAVWPVSETEIWAVGDLLLRSTDGGETWRSLPVSSDMLQSRRLVSIRFAGGKTGWLEQVPTDNTFWVTEDGGETFEKFPLPGLTARGVIYTSAQEAWVVSNEGVYQSASGGRTWTLSLRGQELERGKPLYNWLLFLPRERMLIALGEERLARCQR